MAPTRMLIPVVVSGLACLLVVPFALPDQPDRADTGDPGGRTSSPVLGDDRAAARANDRTVALAVLRGWDRARAAAWRAGDPAALADLYTPGADAGRADRRLLAAYAGRGLRVAGMRMQVAEVEVVSAAPRRVEVVVTDRLVGATVVGRHGRTELPRDRWSRRHLVLVRSGGRWRVERVSDQTWPASTASTSGSENS
ncbi:hypothetical protein [Nocardioides coralli]|uniref:hypothetical protein n=1 Tax=Nocardioides coralli TaxID=2872154 RepID=UPI001CA4299E|nr:hypothetical protein [Nocardioides coralli]QZY30381.1 hypothetical protein K6T13_06915 [Nocardioides coralli]